MGPVLVYCRVADASMRPTLTEGQSLIVQRPPLSPPPRIGDLLVMREPSGRLVVHRLVGRRNGHLLTRGDNQPRNDPPWEVEQLWGRVVCESSGDGNRRRPGVFAGTVLAICYTALPRKVARLVHFLLHPFVWRPEVPRSNETAKISERQPVEPEGRWEIQQLGDEWAIFDTETESVHILNRTAHFIWQKCRDGLDRQRILDEMKHVYPETQEERLEIDLTEALDVLKSAHLI